MKIENEINNNEKNIIENNIQNNLDNNIELKNKNNNFLNNILKSTINNAIDIGLRAILPDLIENQIIDIKNALLENGLNSGIQKAVDSCVDFAKSSVGIFTGNFENISQIKLALGKGGIVDTVSNLLDTGVDKIYQKGYINKNINSLIKNGKNIILNNVTNNIEKTLDNQSNSIEELDKYIDNWKGYYEIQDFEGMAKEYNKIENQLKDLIPLENTLKETRKVEMIHNLIKNNGHNFNITDDQKEIIEKLS